MERHHFWWENSLFLYGHFPELCNSHYKKVTSGTWTHLFRLDFIRPRDPLRIPGWRVVGGEAKGCDHSTGRDQVGPEISSGLIFFTFSIWKMVILGDFQNPRNIGTSKGSSILGSRFLDEWIPFWSGQFWDFWIQLMWFWATKNDCYGKWPGRNFVNFPMISMVDLSSSFFWNV